jgi:superfamily II helicase
MNAPQGCQDQRTCARCGEDKPITGFTFKNKRKGRRHYYCRECMRELIRHHYESHPAYYAKKARRNKKLTSAAQREWIVNFLELHPCVDCGEADIRCLDFDHVRGKKITHVSRMIGNYGWDVIKKEIAKCEVRCANCHRKRTAERRQALTFDSGLP